MGQDRLDRVLSLLVDRVGFAATVAASTVLAVWIAFYAVRDYSLDYGWLGVPFALAAVMGLASVPWLLERQPRLAQPWLIVAVGLLARATWAFYADVRPYRDFAYYWSQAELFTRDPLPALQEAVTPPITIVYYGTIRFLGGGLSAVYVINALAGGLQIWAVYRIAKGLGLAARHAALAAWLYALFPSLVFYSGAASAEVPFVTFAVLGLACATRALASGRGPTVGDAGWLAGAGALFAMAHMTRNVGVMYLAGVMVALALAPRVGWGRKAVLIATVFGAFALTTVPQGLSNLGVHGSYSINNQKYINTNLLFGTSRVSRGGFSQTEIDNIKAMGYRLEPEEEFRRFALKAREIALQRIKDDPWGMLRFALTEKFDRMWGRDFVGGKKIEQVAEPTSRFSLTATYYLLVVLFSLAGTIAIGRRRLTRSTVLLLPVLLIAAVHLVIEVQPRYHVVVMPLFCLAAAHAGAFDSFRRVLPGPAAGSGSGDAA
jgi:4-amino-4-deoxy-L-arabinose transferase-like glycosyltransferase